MESKKIQMNIYSKIENKLVVTRGDREVGSGSIQIGDSELQTTAYKIDKQQGHLVEHRELQTLSCNNL